MKHGFIPTQRQEAIIQKFWMTHYDANNQKETIDIKELYHLYALSNPNQNGIDRGSFISIS